MPERARVVPLPAEQLASKAQAGERGARDALWERFQPLIGHLLQTYPDPAIVEDLPGHAYLVFHRLVHEYDPSRGIPFAYYVQQKLSKALYTFARQHWRLHDHEVCDGRLPGEEKPADHLELPLSAPCGWDRTTPDDDVEQRSILHLLLNQFLEELTPPQRYVVVHRLLRGEGYAEIAAALGRSLGAVRTLYYRACQQLRQRCRENF